MKLELNRAEYATLLETLEIADWVRHAYKSEEPEDHTPHRRLEQKILEAGADSEADDLVQFDERVRRFMPQHTFGEASVAGELIEEFENDCFWEQLAERLVERDLIRQMGESALQKLEFDQREDLEEPYRRLYGEEFLSHGIDRLEILQIHPGTGAGSGGLLS